MKQFIFTIGLPGSGKTTFLKEKGYSDIISADDIKLTIKAPFLYDMSTEEIHEKSVQEARKMAFKRIERGDDIIVMDMGGINSSYTYSIIERALINKYEVKAYFMDTPIDVCIERMSKRGRVVPVSDVYRKNCKLNSSIIGIKGLGVSIETVSYFTNKYLFLDMDGTICSYQKPPRDIDGNVDFVNSKMFENARPVKHIIEWTKGWDDKDKFILGACPNSISMEEKMLWLEKNMHDIKQGNVYFVGNKDYKHVFLKHLIQKLKLDKKDVLVVDDNYGIIENMLKIGVNCIHPSNIDSIVKQ